VLISYTLDQSPWVNRFSNELSRQGADVWSGDRIAPGEGWSEGFLSAMKSSDFVLFLVGRETFGSAAMLGELGAALAARGPRIVPIVEPGLNPEDIPGPLRTRSSIPMTTPEQTALEFMRARG
jgi:hypothetical protein